MTVERMRTALVWIGTLAATLLYQAHQKKHGKDEDDEEEEEDNDSWTDESDEAESAGMSIQVDTEDEGFD